MKRKNLQHITLVESQEPKVENNSVHSSENFLTAERIELKPTYSKSDIENLEHFFARFCAKMVQDRDPNFCRYVI